MYREKGIAAITLIGSATALLFIFPSLFSYHLFQNFEEKGRTVTISLVQPNLDPYTEKFAPEKYSRHLDDFFRTADTICDGETNFLLGPETLIVQQIDEEDPSASAPFRRLLDFQRKYPGLHILLGIHSLKKLEKGKIPPGSRFNREKGFYYEPFNTALFMAAGSRPQFYHKTKLVPLFERMPFVQYLGFLGKHSLELGGYSGTYSLRQEDSRFVLPDASLGILPIVCFESVFGHYIAQNLPREKGFICMITNDGWWKNTPGFIHHFNFSPLRAIECRRDLVRAANTGISALIDARGMVIARTPWWKKATLTGKIHLRGGRTFYARHGDYLGRISLFSGVLLLLYGGIKHRIRKKRS
jgi:apolipoprotein N-acyltransferase